MSRATAGRGAAGAAAASAADSAGLAPSVEPAQLFGARRFEPVAAQRAAAASQIQQTLRVWRKAADDDAAAPQENGAGGEAEAADSAGAEGEAAQEGEAGAAEQPAEVSAKRIARKVYLGRQRGNIGPDYGEALTPQGQRAIANLMDLKDMTVRAAIRARGGGKSQVDRCAEYADLLVWQVANLAAQNDGKADTALKMIKQAAAKAGDHSGPSG